MKDNCAHIPWYCRCEVEELIEQVERLQKLVNAHYAAGCTDVNTAGEIQKRPPAETGSRSRGRTKQGAQTPPVSQPSPGGPNQPPTQPS